MTMYATTTRELADEAWRDELEGYANDGTPYATPPTPESVRAALIELERLRAIETAARLVSGTWSGSSITSIEHDGTMNVTMDALDHALGLSDS